MVAAVRLAKPAYACLSVAVFFTVSQLSLILFECGSLSSGDIDKLPTSQHSLEKNCS
jgi:hypothetical protein